MNQKKGHFWNGKGFYLALTLVIAGAAMASFLAIDSMMTKLQRRRPTSTERRRPHGTAKVRPPKKSRRTFL